MKSLDFKKSKRFWVEGRPVPMPHGETRRNKWVFRDHPVVGWKTLVGLRARQERHPDWPLPLTEPVGLSLQFLVPRNAGDLKNLTWAVEDAMKGIVYTDDKQIIHYLEPFCRLKTPDAHGCIITIHWSVNE